MDSFSSNLTSFDLEREFDKFKIFKFLHLKIAGRLCTEIWTFFNFREVKVDENFIKIFPIWVI